MAEGKVVVTLKAGRDYDAPWVTIGADSPEEAVQLVDRAGNAGLGATVANAAKGLQATYTTAAALGPVTDVTPPQPAAVPTVPAQAAPPVAPAAPAPTAPPADAMFCPHGQRVKRSGTTNGRNWTGHYCPLPKERKAEQCPVVWG